MELSRLITEKRNTKSTDIDIMSSREFVKIMNEEDSNVIRAVNENLDIVAEIIDAVANSFNDGGRLIYVGAGTSGRLGLLDAVECPPTFGVPSEMVVGLIAGGDSAFIKAVEGAEDSMLFGGDDLRDIKLSDKDIVVGLAASGRTPYVISALNYANSIGATTASVSCNSNSEISKLSKFAVELIVGPEVLTGSTRLKAGSAQKMVLNMISTGAMIKIGKVYQNLMVDVMQTNKKLQQRAINIIMESTNCSREKALEALKETSGDVKLSIAMILLGCSLEEAKDMLHKNNGRIRTLL